MYKRETELRHLQPNDVYNLGVILDDNNCWKKLMEIIPKELNENSSKNLNWDMAVESGGLKYTNDHIRLIENAIKRSGESRLFSQILFDEWGTSGRKNERPTVGVLLQLLIKAELYRAAEYVATIFLNEPAPARPTNGPAARIDISFTDEIFNSVEQYVNDSSFFPDTKTLNDNYKDIGVSVMDNNKDYYAKYRGVEKNCVSISPDNCFIPKPPPRPLRSARLQQQQQEQLQPQCVETLENSFPNLQSTVAATNHLEPMEEDFINPQNRIDGKDLNEHSSLNIPNISELMPSNSETLNYSKESGLLSDGGMIPKISLLAMNNHENCSTISNTSESEILPLISELNVKGEQNHLNKSMEKEIESVRDPTASPIFSDHDQGSHSTTSSSNSNRSNTSSSLSNVSLDDDDDDDDNDVELPEVVANIMTSQNDDVAQCGDDDDENSLPNITLLRQRNSNSNNDNDSSLTTVTGTSGENSFELSLNECSSTSNENIPCLSELKQ